MRYVFGCVKATRRTRLKLGKETKWTQTAVSSVKDSLYARLFHLDQKRFCGSIATLFYVIILTTTRGRFTSFERKYSIISTVSYFPFFLSLLPFLPFFLFLIYRSIFLDFIIIFLPSFVRSWFYLI